MIKLVSILMFAVLLLSVSSATYVKKATAVSFTTGPCPRGEARDYIWEYVGPYKIARLLSSQQQEPAK
jgi:hypothetical protein